MSAHRLSWFFPPRAVAAYPAAHHGPAAVSGSLEESVAKRLPEEAEAVRTIFARYLELGSMGALLTELDRQGIRTKVKGRRDGGRSGGIRFGVGSLAHLLKNRFYLGEITYRGEVHRGEHEPILGRDVFEEAKRRAIETVEHEERLCKLEEGMPK